MIKIETLNKMFGNPRTITEEDLEKLKKSIEYNSKNIEGWNSEEGFRLVESIVVNKHNNNVIGGHQRLRAIEELGQSWIHEEDIRWVNITSESDEKALNLALNQISGDFDYDKLDIWMQEMLRDETFDQYEVSGFEFEDFESSMLDYKPEYSPEKDDNEVSEDDIKKAEGKLSSKKEDDKKVEIVCPKCYAEFSISRRDIDEK